MAYSHLVCPLDGAPLTTVAGSLHCANGHQFDIGKPGYVNLLPVQAKRSRAPGDSKAMIDARHAFLNGGAYDGISTALNQRLRATVDAPVNVLDAGCGEGFYLKRLVTALGAQAGDFYGIDISRDAIRRAARGNDAATRHGQWLVANNTCPCVTPGHVDHLLCLFGFPAWPAFAAVLKPGGRVWLVESGRDHLRELRAVLYPDVRDKPLPSLGDAERAGFILQDHDCLCRQAVTLDRKQLGNLLVMTPHFYRAPKEGRDRALALDGLQVTVDVSLRVLATA
ncbi:MAG: methyltransferase domain-containing protein [Alcanivoracaceae bacterium]|nr:methyltransferase domain-containing protein [Alcanivoracaceae bacterium]